MSLAPVIAVIAVLFASLSGLGWMVFYIILGEGHPHILHYALLSGALTTTTGALLFRRAEVANQDAWDDVARALDLKKRHPTAAVMVSSPVGAYEGEVEGRKIRLERSNGVPHYLAIDFAGEIPKELGIALYLHGKRLTHGVPAELPEYADSARRLLEVRGGRECVDPIFSDDERADGLIARLMEDSAFLKGGWLFMPFERPPQTDAPIRDMLRRGEQSRELLDAQSPVPVGLPDRAGIENGLAKRFQSSVRRFQRGVVLMVVGVLAMIAVGLASTWMFGDASAFSSDEAWQIFGAVMTVGALMIAVGVIDTGFWDDDGDHLRPRCAFCDSWQKRHARYCSGCRVSLRVQSESR